MFGRTLYLQAIEKWEVSTATMYTVAFLRHRTLSYWISIPHTHHLTSMRKPLEEGPNLPKIYDHPSQGAHKYIMVMLRPKTYKFLQVSLSSGTGSGIPFKACATCSDTTSRLYSSCTCIYISPGLKLLLQLYSSRKSIVLTWTWRGKSDSVTLVSDNIFEVSTPNLARLFT